MIHARLGADGRLSEISHRASTHPDDVPLAVMPTGSGPWEYDAQQQVAKPTGGTLAERLACVVPPAGALSALLVRHSDAWTACSQEERAAVQDALDRAAQLVISALSRP